MEHINDEIEVSKYYTPELEELHPGFECERLLSNNWEKYICGNSHSSREDDLDPMITRSVLLQYESNKPWVRVKYLDKEDIEELGWLEQVWTSFTRSDRLWFELDNRWLIIFKDTHYISITVRDPAKELERTEFKFNEAKPCYQGECLNKSELKFIMKKLKINEDSKNSTGSKK